MHKPRAEFVVLVVVISRLADGEADAFGEGMGRDFCRIPVGAAFDEILNFGKLPRCRAPHGAHRHR